MVNVLVIDPNSDFRRMLVMALEACGYSVTTARNSYEAQALLHAAQQLPDVILSEVALPDTDGLDFLTLLREHPDWQAIPVIMMAGRSAADVRKTAIRNGANAFLVKPFGFQELSSILYQWGLVPFDQHNGYSAVGY
ncbi:MAG: response regulator [Anaerolineae bacterium]|nr:response regulator [Anaerolineae bacterium]